MRAHQTPPRADLWSASCCGGTTYSPGGLFWAYSSRRSARVDCPGLPAVGVGEPSGGPFRPPRGLRSGTEGARTISRIEASLRSSITRRYALAPSFCRLIKMSVSSTHPHSASHPPHHHVSSSLSVGRGEDRGEGPWARARRKDYCQSRQAPSPRLTHSWPEAGPRSDRRIRSDRCELRLRVAVAWWSDERLKT